MAIVNYIPELWTAQLLSSLKKTLVAGECVNRDYEGEIRAAGDTVHITSISRPSVKDYTSHVDMDSPEAITDADRTLVIDQKKYISFEVDDIEKAQAKGSVMAEAMEESAYALADEIDGFIIGLYTGVAAGNALGAEQITDGDKAYNALIDLRTKLNAASVPRAGRWVWLPSWYTGLLLQNDKFVANPALGQTGQNLLNGHVGRAAGFDIYESENLPTVQGDDDLVVAGYRGAITFAGQIVENEAYRLEKRFADGVKMLHVYGAKLVRPTGIATMLASKT